jgi:hypothetical protein
MTEFLERYKREHSSELKALRAAVSDEYRPLDLSYPSLDRVEEYYRSILGSTKDPHELEQIENSIGHYVAATLIEHTDGELAVAPSKTPQPAVKVSGISKRMFEPLGPVYTFKRFRPRGVFRERTECWDLPQRRAELKRMLASRDKELAHLQRDVERIAGKRIAKLDGTKRNLGMVEEAWRSVALNGTLAERGAMKARLVLLLGTLLVDAIGSGDWSVVEDPTDADFGEWEVARWRPAQATRIGPKTPKGQIYELLRDAIDDGS